MAYNRKLWFALKNKLKKENDIPEQPGIYIWRRFDNGITYFYVGQAKNLLNRRTDYELIRIGKQYPSRHFEASLRKHKDWHFQVLVVCNESMLDYEEKAKISYYNSQPNHITRNELLAEQDIVRSNFRRKEQIENKVISGIRKCLEYVDIQLTPNSLKIGLKTTKKGIPTVLSKKYFDMLITLLGIGAKNEEEKENI